MTSLVSSLKKAVSIKEAEKAPGSCLPASPSFSDFSLCTHTDGEYTLSCMSDLLCHQLSSLQKYEELNLPSLLFLASFVKERGHPVVLAV